MISPKSRPIAYRLQIHQPEDRIRGSLRKNQLRIRFDSFSDGIEVREIDEIVLNPKLLELYTADAVGAWGRGNDMIWIRSFIFLVKWDGELEFVSFIVIRSVLSITSATSY
jgi:hypothetical protein